MATFYAIFGMVALFALMARFAWRQDEKRREERAGLGFSEFAASDALKGVSMPILEAVYTELFTQLGYPPLSEDLIAQDLGIDGSDIDDLILHASQRLDITWHGPWPIVTDIRSVADLAHFLQSRLEAQARE